MTKLLDLPEVFHLFLEQADLVDKKLLLMVSGGVDSVVLLNVALKVCNPINLCVFHLNHNTRVDSEADSNFVQNICSVNKIKFYSHTLVPLDKGETGGSSENDWRKARKIYSIKAAQDFGAQKILTAHHATDLVETMIFRITKGCGPNGLSPFETSTKPFWQIPKKEIIQYAESQKIKWREDATNNNIVHERNLIRHEVLPALRQITPNLEKVFVRESKIFADIDQFIEDSTPPSDQPLPLMDFLALPKTLQSSWLLQIAGTTISQSELQDCLRWLENEPAGNSQKPIGNKTLVIKNKQITLQK